MQKHHFPKQDWHSEHSEYINLVVLDVFYRKSAITIVKRVTTCYCLAQTRTGRLLDKLVF